MSAMLFVLAITLPPLAVVAGFAALLWPVERVRERTGGSASAMLHARRVTAVDAGPPPSALSRG